MEQYISKSALVAEIEKMVKRLEDAFDNHSFASYEANLIAKGGYRKLKDILSLFDTLEVKDFELTWEDVAWIVNKTILLCRVESTLTAEDICKDVLRQFKAQKGE